VLSPVTGTNAATASRIATDYFYDAGGLLRRCDVEHRDETGALVAANPAFSTFFVYDQLHLTRFAVEERPVSPPVAPPVFDPATAGLENFAGCNYGYDSAGQCVRVSTPAVCRAQSDDAVCDIVYDERGMLYRGISGGLGALVSVTTQCDYDARGSMVKATLVSAGGLPGTQNPSASCTFDGFHRLSSCTDPMGNKAVYDYDEQGFVTVSIFGEVNDQPGSTNNVLLARTRRTYSYFEAWPNRWKAPELSRVKVQFHWDRGGNEETFWARLFFGVMRSEDVSTTERFAPGDPAPHPTETTTLSYSPAGLMQSVTRNGDTLLTCGYDTAGRRITCDGKYPGHALLAPPPR